MYEKLHHVRYAIKCNTALYFVSGLYICDDILPDTGLRIDHDPSTITLLTMYATSM